MHNIEKSAFHKGAYVGYGGGVVWTVRQYGRGNWKATPQGNNVAKVFHAPTLRAISDHLTALNNSPTMKTNPTKRGSANIIAADELRIFIDNDAQLYKSQFLPIVENIKRKLKRGVYDHSKAAKLWGYLVESGAKKYNKEFGDGTLSLKMFDKATREHVAAEMADEYLPAIERGDYTAAKNPIRKSRAISGRKGLTKKEYVTRPSQSASHRAPSPRLKARRKAALVAPKGFYPNPLEAGVSSGKAGAISMKFHVQYRGTQTGKWNTIAAFEYKEDAFAYAKKLARDEPGFTLRVMKDE